MNGRRLQERACRPAYSGTRSESLSSVCSVRVHCTRNGRPRQPALMNWLAGWRAKRRSPRTCCPRAWASCATYVSEQPAKGWGRAWGDRGVIILWSLELHFLLTLKALHALAATVFRGAFCAPAHSKIHGVVRGPAHRPRRCLRLLRGPGLSGVRRLHRRLIREHRLEIGSRRRSRAH